MSREKAFISSLMVLILIVLSGAPVWAAPLGQEEPTTISGIVEEIEVDKETNTVLVTLVDELGETHKLSMSLEKAIELGLVDENGDPIVNIGEDVEIPLSDDIEVIEEGEEGWHPVASALTEFFNEYLPDFFTNTLELDYDTIMSHHEEDRMGFGVIAQAYWMASMLYDRQADKNITPGDILDAKKAHDFDSITLSEDGEPIITLPNGEVPTNWGQFRKAVLGSEKAQKNLGAIMSGREKVDQDETGGDDTLGATSTQGQGKGKKGKAGGKPEIPPGQVKGGKPDTPPGKVKNKDKGKGGGKKN